MNNTNKTKGVVGRIDEEFDEKFGKTLEEVRANSGIIKSFIHSAIKQVLLSLEVEDNKGVKEYLEKGDRREALGFNFANKEWRKQIKDLIESL